MNKPHALPQINSEYMNIDYEEITTSKSGKTFIIPVQSKSRRDLLGIIKWYGPWRQYTFEPEYATIFSRGCLQEIKDYLEKLMELWRYK